jgi:pyruvate/2-oxoglutarate dehydrogenase complex dihydrolipoamide acyltransferase (E2) component
MPPNTPFRTIKIPSSRLATFDVFSVALEKHHVVALLEIDVTAGRENIRELKRSGEKVSFNAWLLKSIADTIALHPEIAGFKLSSKKLISFEDVNISFLIEKMIDGVKVPIPLVIKQAHVKTIREIHSEIENAKKESLSAGDIVINRKPDFWERLYYRLPGTIRRFIWRQMLKRARFAYGKMGNISITSVGMMGVINGWFIHRSVHPFSAGIGSVIKKPVVINDKIEIREMLQMTLLLDHDVADGAPMARFVKDLVRRIERG